MRRRRRRRRRLLLILTRNDSNHPMSQATPQNPAQIGDLHGPETPRDEEECQDHRCAGQVHYLYWRHRSDFGVRGNRGVHIFCRRSTLRRRDTDDCSPPRGWPQPASAAVELADKKPAQPLAMGMDENLASVWVIDGQGKLTTYRAAGGELLKTCRSPSSR